jgi:hypothetical protein
MWIYFFNSRGYKGDLLMKRRFSFKFACVLCTVILFMTNISATAFAGLDYEIVEVEGEQFVLGGGQCSTFDSVQNQFTDGAEDDSSTEVVYSSYSILSEREKEYYDRIVSTPMGETEFTIEYSPYLTKEEFAAIDFTAVMHAVAFDHPEMFWYNGYSAKYRYKKSTNEIMSVIYTLRPPFIGDTDEPVYAVEDYEKIKFTVAHELMHLLDARHHVMKDRCIHGVTITSGATLWDVAEDHLLLPLCDACISCMNAGKLSVLYRHAP